MFGFSKSEYIFPFTKYQEKCRKVLTGLVSSILKFGQEITGISGFIWPQFIYYTEGIEIGFFF